MFSFSDQLECKLRLDEAQETVIFLLKIKLASPQINTEDMDDKKTKTSNTCSIAINRLFVKGGCLQEFKYKLK